MRHGSARACGFANYADLGLRGTTGGAGGKIVHVTNRADFEKYAGAEEPYIIILDADLKAFTTTAPTLSRSTTWCRWQATRPSLEAAAAQGSTAWDLTSRTGRTSLYAT